MKKCRVGIEINEKKLQLAVVARQKTEWRLIEALTIPVTSNNMAQTLKQVHREIAGSTFRVVASLPYNQILMKEIRVDSSLSDQEVYEYLQQQSTTLFGQPSNHWFLDFEPSLFSKKNPQQTIFRVVATPRENMTHWIKIADESGFRISAIDVDVLALARLTPTFEHYQPDQPQALLWIKETELLLIISQAGHLIYSKRTTYSPAHSIAQVLPPLIQFFNGLYPQYILSNILFLDENPPVNSGNLEIKPAVLNNVIWKIPSPLKHNAFCSLGLTLYEH